LPVMIIGGVGIGFTFTVNNDNVLATAPKERAGAAAAVSETAFELGGALGIAILGTVLNSVYRANLRVPAGIPAGAAEESIAGATGTAAALSPEAADQLMRAARTAFVSGVHVTALVTAGVLAVVAVLALTGLRGVPKVIREESPVRP
ncbi:MAG: MFS transporter, partial [Nonomuraea sp.]|nr:MFS transporter [Nonomuraea sp.]